MVTCIIGAHFLNVRLVGVHLVRATIKGGRTIIMRSNVVRRAMCVFSIRALSTLGLCAIPLCALTLRAQAMCALLFSVLRPSVERHKVERLSAVSP